MKTGEPGARYASVAVPVPVRRLFTYRVHDAHSAEMRPGTRVRVSFGHRKVVGTVVEWPAPAPEPGVEAKAIESIIADARRLPPAVLELTRFLADYYLSSWGEAIEAALPPAPRLGTRRAVRRLAAAEPATLPARATAQRRLLERLPADGSTVPVARLTAGERRAAAALARAGTVEIVEEPAERAPETPAARVRETPEAGPVPTPKQVAVLDELRPALAARAFAPFLLFGETGSGKTEVYFRAAREMLDRGRSVLYLVPEISLTPLLLAKVRRRFTDGVALLHSGLSRRARYQEWLDIRAGLRRLVVGTRSAVFAPLSDLGLIIVDEEQDGSYKQEETPRYNARDLAIVRARAESAVVLLGSATPSMESFQHARSGRYRLLRLGARIEERPLPTVTFVDMRLEYQRHGVVVPLSRALALELNQCVERGEQALVLRNRRGWAAAVVCPTCGVRIACESCSVSMTWHQAEQRLRCHYCGRHGPFPPGCPTCGAAELKLLGEGTERIEELIRHAVPGAVVERMDRDSMRRKSAQEDLLTRFDRGEVDIIVGTQMIAKGHDFPRVTVVGVLSADQALGMPDFRAGERVFQLLTQVAGRAGRGERPGRVLVQAFEPEHDLLRQAARQDYEAFFDSEMRYRRALRYPPLAALVQLVIQDPKAHQARRWAEILAAALAVSGEGRLLIGGPGPAPLERLKGRYRQQILVRTVGRRRLVQAVEAALGAVEGQIPRKAITVDVDPYSLL